MRQIHVTAAAITELELMLNDRRVTLDLFRKRLRVFVEAHAWDWFSSKETFNRNARLLYREYNSIAFKAWEAEQKDVTLLDLFIMRSAACAPHAALDGLTLPVDNPFWSSHIPPLSWGCSCYISACSSRPFAMSIMGADPGKAIPPEWLTPDPLTGHWKGVDPLFQTREKPGLLTIIAAIVDGAIPDDCA